MVKKTILLIAPFFLIFGQTKTIFSQTPIEQTSKIVNEVIAKSYPELVNTNIKIKTFQSKTDYFKARFSFTNFLTFQKIQTIIFVNPLVFEKNAPENGIRAILAHELAHALYYQGKNRLQLFGLVKLLNGESSAKFERGADLVAIFRGYGKGLIEYREWLYTNIPPQNIAIKKRNYFTPEEINLLILTFEANKSVFERLSKNVPLNLIELEKELKNK